MCATHPFFLSLQPMEQRDYILREIEKLGMLLRAIVTRVFGGNANNAVPEEKQDEVTSALMENAGFDLKAFIRMDDALAIKYLQDRRDFNIPNLEDLALILEKLGAAEPKATEPGAADPLASEPLPPLPLNAEPGIADPAVPQPKESRSDYLKKALLILEHCRETDRTYSFERESRIGALKTALEEPDVVI